MRKFLVAALFLLILQSAAFAAGGNVKIGVFSPEEVVKASEPGNEAIKQLETKFKPENDRLEKQNKEVMKMQEDFQKQAFALAPEARQDKERELRRKEFELSEAVRMFQNSINRERGLKLNELEKVLNEVVTDYSSKNGFSLVIAKVPGIVYFAESASDITKPLTLELNKAWKSRPKK